MRLLAPVLAFLLSATAVLAADLAEVAAGLKSKDATARAKAAAALGAAGKDALPFARPLCDATLDKDPQVAAAALKAVGDLDPRLALPLSDLVIPPPPTKKSSGRPSRASAVSTIGNLKEGGLPAAGVLLALLKREVGKGKLYDPVFSQALASVLARVGADDAETVKTFETIATTKGVLTAHRQLALTYFEAAVRDKPDRFAAARATLAALIADPEPVLARGALAQAAAAGAAAAPLLPAVDQAKLARDPLVRRAAFDAAEKIGAAGKK